MNKKNIVLHIATPFLLLIVCIGLLIVAMIKPADKLKVLVNVAFMDSLKSDPTNDDTGLVIRENEIKSEHEGETYETGKVIRAKFGERYATITLHDLEIPVYWGSTSELLERGACHSSSSKIIGENGNSVISAHVDTYFADLDKLKEGDVVTVKTNYGIFTYKVRETISFSSSEKKYVTPKNDNRLTLYTCKRDLLGASDERIGVICDLTESQFYFKEDEK